MMPRRRPATCFVRGNTRPPLLSSAVALPSGKLPKSAPGAVIMAPKALLPAITTGGPRPIPLAPIGRSWRKRRRPGLARPGVIVWAGLLSAPATTTTRTIKGPRVRGTTWAGFTGTPVPTAIPDTPPGKAALGRPPARKRFGAAVRGTVVAEVVRKETFGPCPGPPRNRQRAIQGWSTGPSPPLALGKPDLSGWAIPAFYPSRWAAGSTSAARCSITRMEAAKPSTRKS